MSSSAVYRAKQAPRSAVVDADPVRTEVLRHALGSAAEQMRRALIRTSFSPIIYEALDFAVALYDDQFRLLGQAPGVPIFMGTLGMCAEGAVEAVGGVDALEPGDVLAVNSPYVTGAHPNDFAVVKPVFQGLRELIGYSVVKGHILDVGAKEPAVTDSVDVFQEGTIFPGVKLLAHGERVRDIWRMLSANSRLPERAVGDMDALVACAKVGATALLRLVERHGLEQFTASVERMFDHGEGIVRRYFEQVPDGRYVGHGVIDSDGRSEDAIPFEVVVEVAGSTVCIHLSNAPDARPGPVNCPLPATVSASRVAITMLAGNSDVAPTEGHLRPIDIVTRPGSMFDVRWPTPCGSYARPSFQLIEALFNALGSALPEAVPACSGGDTAPMMWWGLRAGTGERWADGFASPVGQGAHHAGDGGSSIMHIGMSATRLPSVEVWEARNPWLLEKVELAPDSGGPGRFRGGLGLDIFFQALEDSYVTTIVDRTKTRPWGLEGGREGRANSVVARDPNGAFGEPFGKRTGLLVSKGTVIELRTGGGGGYGDPADRSPERVLADIREGYVSEAEARHAYPHAFR
jgi:N-methylhydantoinase B